MSQTALTVQNIQYSSQNLTSYLNTAVVGSTGSLSASKFGRLVTLYFHLGSGAGSSFKNNSVITNALPETLRPQNIGGVGQQIGASVNYNQTPPISSMSIQLLGSWHLEGATGNLHIQQWGVGETAYPGSYADWSLTYLASTDTPLTTVIA
jgi:hypothetical protein